MCALNTVCEECLYGIGMTEAQLVKYAYLGDVEMVKELLPRTNPRYDGNAALLNACKYGHVEVVRLLLADPRTNPGARESLSLQWACENGHTEIVKLLLASGKVNPEAENGYPFRIALRNRHLDIVKLFSP